MFVPESGLSLKESMDPITLDIIGVLARWALTALSAWLVQHHVITTEQGETFVTACVHNILAAAPGVIALAWGLWAKYHGRIKLLVAASEANMTEDEIKAVIKSGAVTPTVKTPANTVPGVPK